MEDIETQSSIFEVRAWEDARNRKVIAAWGLAKLGDKEALVHLGQMLDDSLIRTRNSTYSGQRLRAAQAIADVFNLPFEWNMDYVPVIRKWWEENQQRVLKDGK